MNTDFVRRGKKRRRRSGARRGHSTALVCQTRSNTGHNKAWVGGQGWTGLRVGWIRLGEHEALTGAVAIGNILCSCSYSAWAWTLRSKKSRRSYIWHTCSSLTKKKQKKTAWRWSEPAVFSSVFVILRKTLPRPRVLEQRLCVCFFFLNTIALPLSLCLSGFLGVRRKGKKKTIWAVGGPECTAGGANPDIKGFELTQVQWGKWKLTKNKQTKKPKKTTTAKKKQKYNIKQRTYKL